MSDPLSNRMELALRACCVLVIGCLAFSVAPARAETAPADLVEVSHDYGGFLVAYEAKWTKLAARHVTVRLSGPCVSACTILAKFIPRQDICVTPTGSMGFHMAFPPFITPDLWKDYPPDIQAWITQKGGLTYSLLWLQAPEIYRFFKRCGPGQ